MSYDVICNQGSMSQLFQSLYAVSYQFPQFKKTRNRPRATDHGQLTDRPSYRDAWTHLKTSLSNLQFPRFIMPTRNRPSTQPLAVRVAQGKILPHPSRKLCLSSKCNNNSLNHSNWVSVAQLALDFSQQLYRPLGRLGDHMRHPE